MTTPRRTGVAPRSLLSNTVAGGISLGWITLLTFAVTPILLRRLGTVEYGAWVLLTVVLIQGRGLASLLDLGLQQSLIARIAGTDDLDEAGRRLGAGLGVLVGIGISAGLVLAAAAPSIVGAFDLPRATAHEATTALRVLAGQVAIDLPGVGWGSALEGLRRYEMRRALDAGRATIFLVGAVWVAGQGRGLVAIALVSAAAALWFAIGAAAASLRAGLRPVSGGHPRAEVRQALPFAALRITGVTFRQLDKVVLGLVATTVAVAGFDVAEKANLAPLAILGVATSALIPAAAARRRTDWAGTQALVARATRWSSTAAMPLAAVAAAVAPSLARLVAGTHIDGAAAAMRWLLLSTILAAVAAAGFELAMGIGGARRLAPISIAGLVVNVVATVALARAYGLAGTASASFLAVAFEVPLQVMVISRLFDLRPSALISAAGPGLILAVVGFAPAFVVGGHGSDVGSLVQGAAAGLLAVALAAAAMRRSRVLS